MWGITDVRDSYDENRERGVSFSILQLDNLIWFVIRLR